MWIVQEINKNVKNKGKEFELNFFFIILLTIYYGWKKKNFVR